jgi:hypothetical protein
MCVEMTHVTVIVTGVGQTRNNSLVTLSTLSDITESTNYFCYYVTVYICVFMNCYTSCCLCDILVDPRNVCMYVSRCVCVYIHACMYAYVRISVCMYVWMCVRIYYYYYFYYYWFLIVPSLFACTLIKWITCTTTASTKNRCGSSINSSGTKFSCSKRKLKSDKTLSVF